MKTTKILVEIDSEILKKIDDWRNPKKISRRDVVEGLMYQFTKEINSNAKSDNKTNPEKLGRSDPKWTS